MKPAKEGHRKSLNCEPPDGLKTRKAVASILLANFAERQSVRLRRDDCDDFVIVGSGGTICDYGDGKHLLVCVTDPEMTAGRWTAQVAKIRAAGGTITQSGDSEGCFHFDPENAKMRTIATKVIWP